MNRTRERRPFCLIANRCEIAPLQTKYVFLPLILSLVPGVAVLLFIDRLPLHLWHYEKPDGKTITIRSVSLGMLLADPGPRDQPKVPQLQRWRLDTGCTGEGMIWRKHLLDSGLDPTRLQGPGAELKTEGGLISCPTRKAALWLYSNIPALVKYPCRIPLSPSIPFKESDWPPANPPDLHAPILGLRPVLRSGLRVCIDAHRETVSVWVPGGLIKNTWLWLRRLPSGFRTLPPTW